MPNDYEASHLRSIIASSPADVARYETEIWSLQQILNRLVSERDVLQWYTDQCRGVFAPVRRLPPEILAEIFTLCSSTRASYLCCDGTQYAAFDAFAGQHHLVNLLQVCSAWYNTITTTASLWAKIEVDTDLDPRMDPKFYIHRALDLSRHFPLTVQVNACDGGDDSALELLGQCADRWRFADLYLDEDASSRLWRVKGNLPRLERLGLGGYGAQETGLFETAPSLTHVVLSDINGALPKLPWSQLRGVTYHSSHPNLLDADVIANRLAVMSRCSNQCEFNMYSLNLGHLNLSTLTFIPTQSEIHTLRLAIIDRHGEEHSRAALCEIIGSLTLPCLRELLFRSSRPHITPLFWPRNSFPAFAARSSLGGTLIKLFLYHMIIAEDELVECLSEMSVLQELFIQDNTEPSGLERENHILLSDSLFQRFAWQPDSSYLVPDLKYFAFASLLFFDDRAFMQFVDSRLVSGATRDGPFTIEAISLIDSEPEPDIVGTGLGVLAIARIAALQKNGQLRWSRHASKHLQQKFPDVVVF